jgi:hypothetical protein
LESTGRLPVMAAPEFALYVTVKVLELLNHRAYRVTFAVPMIKVAPIE